MTTHPLTTLAAVPAPVSNGPDPYAYYESRGKGKGKGKDWPHPIVPESSSYGLIFVGIALAALILSRWLNRRYAR